MKLPQIALDMDGVLVGFHSSLLETYNQRFDPKLSYIDLDGDFETLGSEVANRLKSIFNEKGFFKELQPLPNAINIATRLTDLYSVVICTAPARDLDGLVNPFSAAEKYEWIRHYLPTYTNSAFITMSKYLVAVDMLVDDYPGNIVKWCDKHPKGIGYLVDQPWNQKFIHCNNNIVRGSLEDVINFIDAFWCESRGGFHYRLEELKQWQT